jgi:hypothetical protein
MVAPVNSLGVMRHRLECVPVMPPDAGQELAGSARVNFQP